MTYRAIAFTSLAEFNQTVDANSTWRPIGMAAGHVANSWCVMFDIPEQKEEEAVAEKGSHKPEKYPAEAEEDPMVEEEEVKEKPEEEEKPEKPRRAVPRRPAAPLNVARKAAPAIRQHHQQQKKKGK